MNASFKLSGMSALTEEQKKLAVMALVEALVVIDMCCLASNDVALLADAARDGRVKLRSYAVTSLARAALASAEDAWLDIPSILAVGSGNARDFACWRIAELRNGGEREVGAYLKVSSPKPHTNIYEILVRRGGMLEDPSRLVAAVGGDAKS